MQLITKCPSCETSFSVGLEQLQLRKGYIRCVSCSHIFDGYDAVVPDGADQSVTAPEVFRSKPKATTPTSHVISDLKAEGDLSDDTFTDPFVISDPETVNGGNAQDGDKATFDINLESTPHTQDSPHLLYEYKPTRWALIAWSFLIAFGLGVLFLQLIFIFRVQIAEAMPTLRPSLENMCTKLNCTVAWSRKPEMIIVTHSSLQADLNQSTKDNESHVTLQVNLRNAYDKPQEWPSLVLKLTDSANAKIAQKNISAKEYLSSEMFKMPFPANSEHIIHLPITLYGLNVNGYQLTTFFP